MILRSGGGGGKGGGGGGDEEGNKEAQIFKRKLFGILGVGTTRYRASFIASKYLNRRKKKKKKKKKKKSLG
ncbi:hypothetical protein M0804_001307 [Polistes exclamans]|nr:hypothetical protein M0804_001307 [Polistes exclamans]